MKLQGDFKAFGLIFVIFKHRLKSYILRIIDIYELKLYRKVETLATFEAYKTGFYFKCISPPVFMVVYSQYHDEQRFKGMYYFKQIGIFNILALFVLLLFISL